MARNTLRRQEPVLDRLMSTNTINKLVSGEAAQGAQAYTAIDMLNDLKKNIFSEIYAHQPIDVYRRNLQRAYVDNLTELVAPPAPSGNMMFGSVANPSKSDAAGIGRAQLVALRTELRAATGGDGMTRSHVQDLIARINKALDPK